MDCTSCEDSPTKVLETRVTRFGWTKRKRECYSCGFRFFTIEIPREQLDMTEIEQRKDDERTEDG